MLSNDVPQVPSGTHKTGVDPERTLEAHRMEASVLGTRWHESGYFEIVEINIIPATVKQYHQYPVLI